MAKQFYKMAMVFTIDFKAKTLNEIMRLFSNDPEHVLKDAATITVKQTVDFIPTQEILQQYADAIKQSYPQDQIDNVEIADVRFLRYDYLYPVDENETSESQ